MFRFLRNPKLLDIVESLVGGEILCHPTQHLRAVLPTALKDLTRTVDWHQDAAVLRPEANDHLIVTTWIPIVDVTEEQGCLQVLPGSQRSRHRYEPTNGHRVAPEVVAQYEPLPLPVPAGGMILFHNYTLHAGRPNESDRVRWSTDLRWQDPAKPTGRPHYPGFIVRSRTRPETVQDDFSQWRDRAKVSRRLLTLPGHSRASGNLCLPPDSGPPMVPPLRRGTWIPAQAGMTGPGNLARE